MLKSLNLKSFLLLLVFSIAGLSNVWAEEEEHPFHVSVTELMYNSRTHFWEMSIKLFSDDLEQAVKRRFNSKSLHLSTEKEHPEANELIKKYLQNHLSLKVGDQPLKMEWIGREGDLDEIWVYVQFSDKDLKGQFYFSNTLLTDVLENQENIIHVQMGELKKTYRLSRKERYFVLDHQ